MRIFAALCFACLLGALSCRHHAGSLVLPLQWRTTDNIYDLPSAGVAALAFQRVSIVLTEDSRRAAGHQIGQNRQEAIPRPVTTSDDIATFVENSLAEVLKANGVLLVSSGATRVLDLTVLSFSVTEENTYHAGVSLAVDLQDGAGKSPWKGTALSKATRWGRSFEASNYQEALSDALLNALENLLDTPAFQSALRG